MKNLKYIFLIVCTISFFACKKNQLGGKSNIKGKVTHHHQPIANARVYIKFNATEFPGKEISAYDTYIDADHNGNFLIEKIYRGNYYFYAVGFDPTINMAVTGGIPLKVKMLKEITGFEVPVVE